MRNMIEPFARSWRRPLLGALTMAAAALPAVADPTLTYSTYLGGSRPEYGDAVAVHEGTTCIAGSTHSLDFPVFGSRVISSKPLGYESNSDVFVTCLGPSGAPIYSTYVPAGYDNKSVLGIGLVGPYASAYVVAVSVRGGTLTTIANLDGGGGIVWSRQAYGERWYPNSMTVDSQGNVYIVGHDDAEQGPNPAEPEPNKSLKEG